MRKIEYRPVFGTVCFGFTYMGEMKRPFIGFVANGSTIRHFDNDLSGFYVSRINDYVRLSQGYLISVLNGVSHITPL